MKVQVKKYDTGNNSRNSFMVLLGLILLIVSLPEALACEVCKSNQPEGLKGITHGTGPQGNIDYIIVALATVIVLVTLVLALKYLLRPNDNQHEHIKNIVIEQRFSNGR